MQRSKKQPPSKTVKKLKPRKKLKAGRSRGTVNISKFDETKIGFLLKWRAPTEYALIMSMTSDAGRSYPDWSIINKVGFFSSSPVFESLKYEKYLIEYRRYGLYIAKPRRVTKHTLKNFKKKISRN